MAACWCSATTSTATRGPGSGPLQPQAKAHRGGSKQSLFDGLKTSLVGISANQRCPSSPPGFAASRAPDQMPVTQSRGRLGRPAPVSTNPYNHLHFFTGATPKAAPHCDSQGLANGPSPLRPMRAPRAPACTPKPPSPDPQAQGRQRRANGVAASNLPQRNSCHPDRGRIGPQLCRARGAAHAPKAGAIRGMGVEKAKRFSQPHRRATTPALIAAHRLDRAGGIGVGRQRIGRDIAGGLQQVFGGHDTLDQAIGQRLVCTDFLPAHQDQLGAGRAN